MGTLLPQLANLFLLKYRCPSNFCEGLLEAYCFQDLRISMPGLRVSNLGLRVSRGVFAGFQGRCYSRFEGFDGWFCLVLDGLEGWMVGLLRDAGAATRFRTFQTRLYGLLKKLCQQAERNTHENVSTSR